MIKRIILLLILSTNYLWGQGFILKTTSEILELQTSSSAGIDFQINWADIDLSSGATPGSSEGKITSATSTTVVLAPASSIYRLIKNINIKNIHGSASNTIIFKKDISATEYQLTGSVTLLSGESLIYLDGVGWILYGANGIAYVPGLINDGDKGDITVTGSGSIWTIDSLAVTEAKIADSSVTAIKIISNAVTTTGLATSSVTSAKILDGTIATADLANDAITNDKLANVATQTFKGRTTAATGDPEDLTISQAKTMLNLTGTNSGDQTLSGLLPALTSGSVLFSNGTTIAQDNANLFWDDTNNRLGIGTASPSGKLHVVDAVGSFDADNLIRFETTAGTIGPSMRFKANAGGDYLLTATGSGNGGGAGHFRIYDMTGNATRFFIQSATGNVGIGTASPTAALHLKAGTATASTSPLKFTSGPLNTTAEAGAVEFLTDAFYGTITTGTARKQFAFTTDIIDGLTTNEGALSVTAGTGTTSVIHSNTSGSTDVTLVAGTNITISENTGTGTITIDAAAGSGESNTASNLGGGIANWDSKSGVDLRFNSFKAADFDLTSNLISFDNTNAQKATTGQNGILTSTDWTTFNNKQSTITLTTTGSSGSSTLTGSTLNIPQYTGNAGTVTSVAALTLGTTGTDLSSTVATGTTTPVITLNVPNASASNRGALLAADWTTFNNKLSTTGSAASLTSFPTLNQNTTGNAATVTTNANLTGVVTSTGNATAIANGAITNAMLANGAVANLSGTNTGDNATNTLYSGLVSNATHTGDATGATALTLATVNSNVGSFGSSTSTNTITVNGKGLVTAITNAAIPTATTSVTGLVTSTDWNTFNNKLSSEVDGSLTNEIQSVDTFNIVGNYLKISLLNDNKRLDSVNLSSFLDNTDGQTLSFTTPNLTISGGNSVDLSTLLTGGTTNVITQNGNILTSVVNGITDTTLTVRSVSNTSSTNNLSSTVNGVTGSNVSIINTNVLNLSGNQLTETINGVSDTSLVIGSNVLTFSNPNLTVTTNGVASNTVNLSALSSAGYTIVNISSTPYNAAQTSGKHILLVDATSGNVTINLPTAVGNTTEFVVKKIDSSANTVTVDGSASETIDGDLTAIIMFQYTVFSFVSNNANWFIIN